MQLCVDASNIKENDSQDCCRVNQKQSSGLYRNTFKIVENPLNSVKQTTILEVACNYDLAYNGKIYKFEEPITTENSVTVITKNVQKKNKKVGAKIFDINTILM